MYDFIVFPEKIVQLIEKLGSYSIVASQVKHMIGLMRGPDDETLSPLCSRLMHALSTIARKETRRGAYHYFDFQEDNTVSRKVNITAQKNDIKIAMQVVKSTINSLEALKRTIKTHLVVQYLSNLSSFFFVCLFLHLVCKVFVIRLLNLY